MESIVCELKENIDQLVVIYLSGVCLTGILVGVSDDACKIVSRGAGTGRRSRVAICRLCDIQAVAFC